jgi:hypothetical protein
LSGANFAHIQGVRSNAYLEVRERQTTQKMGKIDPPSEGSLKMNAFFVAPP